VTLHGTGGNEQDLIPFAMEVSPTSAILSPRGNVVENGMPRFFRRLSNNVFDEEDVIGRTHALADFIVSAGDAYGRDPARMTALGYSNGANIAAAVLFLRPEVFSRAILLRPMLPLQTPDLPDLRGRKILLLRGKQDTVIPPDSTAHLEQALRSAGADVTSAAIDAGHEITVQDVQTISRWLAAQQAAEQKDALTTLSSIPA
jgi:predicted esterase